VQEQEHLLARFADHHSLAHQLSSPAMTTNTLSCQTPKMPCHSSQNQSFDTHICIVHIKGKEAA
jgi:hypothetical protein